MQTLGLLVIALYYSGVAYLMTNSLYFAIGVLILFLFASLLLIAPLIKEYTRSNRKKHEVFHFINHFIVSLTITSSLDQAFMDATLEAKGEEQETLKSVSHLTIADRLEYLTMYFGSDIYQVFLSIIKLYQEEGGNLIEIASPLLDEAAYNEEKQNALETIQKKSIIQFSSMWILSSVILCFLRIGLSSFYDVLTKNLPYLITTAAYFLIAIISFSLYARAISGGKSVKKKEAQNEK